NGGRDALEIWSTRSPSQADRFVGCDCTRRLHRCGRLLLHRKADAAPDERLHRAPPGRALVELPWLFKSGTRGSPAAAAVPAVESVLAAAAFADGVLGGAARRLTTSHQRPPSRRQPI